MKRVLVSRLLALVLSSTLVLGLAACAGPSVVSPDGNTLQRPDLHVTITKPPGWRFLTPKEKFDARKAVDYVNKGWDMGTKQETFPARIVIAKYPEPRATLNPTVSIDLYPFGPLIQNDAKRAAGWVLGSYLRHIFTPVEIVADAQWTELAGRKAAYFHIRYSLATKNGGTHVIDEKVWSVTRGTSAYLIFARGAQSGEDAATAELQAIVQSLRFED